MKLSTNKIAALLAILTLATQCFAADDTPIQPGISLPANTADSAAAFCNLPGDTLVTGDFNGDNLQDELCNSHNGAMTLALGSATGEQVISWSKPDRKFCIRANNTLVTGDFNGDGRDDLLCRAGWRSMYIDLADESGEFTRTDWNYGLSSFCRHRNDKLIVGDFNGDGRDDLFCNHYHGKNSIDLADKNGHFYGINWLQHSRFCSGQGENISANDVNNDNRDDLICTSQEGLTVAIDLAAPSDLFEGSDWVLCGSDLCAATDSAATAKR